MNTVTIHFVIEPKSFCFFLKHVFDCSFECDPNLLSSNSRMVKRKSAADSAPAHTAAPSHGGQRRTAHTARFTPAYGALTALCFGIVGLSGALWLWSASAPHSKFDSALSSTDQVLSAGVHSQTCAPLPSNARSAERARYEACGALGVRRCARVIRDHFLSAEEVGALQAMAGLVMNCTAGGSGGPTVWDVASGALSKGDVFVDAWKVMHSVGVSLQPAQAQLYHGTTSQLICAALHSNNLHLTVCRRDRSCAARNRITLLRVRSGSERVGGTFGAD
jgi:hypothetical protein